MSYHPTTEIISKSLSGPQDQALKMGSAVMKRKWNTSWWPTGSFVEAWLGFRIRVNPAYYYSSSALVDEWYYSGTRFAAGFCDTSGYVYGQTGSGIFPKHTLAGIIPVQGSDVWPRDSTGSYAYGNLSSNLEDIADGTSSLAVGISGNTLTFDSRIRNLYILRFTGLTGSSITPDWGTSSLSILSANTSIFGQSFDYTSSAFIAEMMNQSNWTSLVNKFPLYTQQASSNILHISQPTYGYFDGIFFSWNKSYDFLEISDVVVRFL